MTRSADEPRRSRPTVLRLSLPPGTTLRISVDREGRPSVSPCDRCVLEAVQKNGPLRRAALIAALHAAGRRYSLSAVKASLSRLIADGLIVHGPAGYASSAGA